MNHMAPSLVHPPGRTPPFSLTNSILRFEEVSVNRQGEVIGVTLSKLIFGGLIIEK